jgi:hypothetical protein
VRGEQERRHGGAGLPWPWRPGRLAAGVGQLAGRHPRARGRVWSPVAVRITPPMSAARTGAAPRRQTESPPTEAGGDQGHGRDGQVGLMCMCILTGMRLCAFSAA